MGTGARSKRQNRNNRQTRLSLGPEYPALSSFERAEGAAIRLDKSKRKFLTSRVGSKNISPLVQRVVGKAANNDFATHSEIGNWLSGWKFPAVKNKPDIETSSSVFVGVIDSSDMPFTSKVQNGAPYAVITSRFIEMCWRVSELFPTFAAAIRIASSDAVVASREMLFDYLDFSKQSGLGAAPEEVELFRDELFALRTTRAATRWAIAHEIAHLVVGKKGRNAAFDRARACVPMIEDAWDEARATLPHAHESLARYRDEIACDVLAVEAVMDSPFADADLLTEVAGSLVALEGLIWSGWFQDESSISPTHPSPTLRFHVVFLVWMKKLTERSTWISRRAPSPLGIRDVAYLWAFEKWAAGDYGSDRRGPKWWSDIEFAESALEGNVDALRHDSVFVSRLNVIEEIASRE